MEVFDGILFKVEDRDIYSLLNNPKEFWSGIYKIGGNAFKGSCITELLITPTVKSISYYAFDGASNLRHVRLPNTLEALEDGAFARCTSLERISIPQNIKKIKKETFIGCSNLKKVVLGDGVEEIEMSAFELCGNLEEIKFPKSLKKIGRMAFLRCENLDNLVFPDGLERIEPGAFCLCKNLKELTIPESVSFIGKSAFERCDSLTKLVVGNKKCLTDDVKKDLEKLKFTFVKTNGREVVLSKDDEAENEAKQQNS